MKNLKIIILLILIFCFMFFIIWVASGKFEDFMYKNLYSILDALS